MTLEPQYLEKLCVCGGFVRVQLQDHVDPQTKLAMARAIRFVVCPDCGRGQQGVGRGAGKRSAKREVRLPYADN